MSSNSKFSVPFDFTDLLPMIVFSEFIIVTVPSGATKLKSSTEGNSSELIIVPSLSITFAVIFGSVKSLLVFTE